MSIGFVQISSGILGRWSALGTPLRGNFGDESCRQCRADSEGHFGATSFFLELLIMEELQDLESS